MQGEPRLAGLVDTVMVETSGPLTYMCEDINAALTVVYLKANFQLHFLLLILLI